MERSLDATLTAHGIRSVGEGQLEASPSYGNSRSPGSIANFLLASRAPVRLALPPGTKTFGVQFDEVRAETKRACAFTLRSPQRKQDVDLSDHRSAQFSSHADGSDLPWVELELRCSTLEYLALTELLLSPPRVPTWPGNESESAVSTVSPAAIPAPQRDGQDFVWDPPVPLAYSCADKVSDLTAAVASAPAVLAALGLRAGVDELSLKARYGSGTQLEQQLVSPDRRWKIQDSSVQVELDDGYLLRKIHASGVQQQPSAPRGKLITVAAAKAIAKHHERGFSEEPELALFQGKPVYVFDGCRPIYVHAFTGALSVGGMRCIIQ